MGGTHGSPPSDTWDHHQAPEPPCPPGKIEESRPRLCTSPFPHLPSPPALPSLHTSPWSSLWPSSVTSSLSELPSLRLRQSSLLFARLAVL